MQAALLVNEYNNDLDVTSLADQHKGLMSQVVQTGDRVAFEGLYVYFGPRIKALLLKSGAEPAQADDLVQIVMMTVWRKGQTYAPERGSVSAWVFTIARNARIDFLRRGSSQPYQDVYELDLPNDDMDGVDRVMQSDAEHRIGAALSDLPDDQRTIIEMAFLEDLSQSEIAKKLQLPLGTVKSRMRLAYGKLKVKLEELSDA